MSVLEKLNLYFYSTRFSIFDLLYIVLIGDYAASNGILWLLLVIPCAVLSVKLTNMFGK